jgi:hypothetical protein
VTINSNWVGIGVKFDGRDAVDCAQQSSIGQGSDGWELPQVTRSHNLPQPSEAEGRLDTTTNREERNCKREEVSPKLRFAVNFYFCPKSHAWFLLSA